MKGLENPGYLVGLIASNLIAILFVWFSLRRPQVARVAYFLLFAWACGMNWSFSQNNPAVYQEYADLTFLNVYHDFIKGWFSRNSSWVVAAIATSQGLIALSLLMKSRIYKLGCIGGMIFLLAIAPLGVGSGFPCTLIFAAGLYILYSKGKKFIWIKERRPVHLTEQ